MSEKKSSKYISVKGARVHNLKNISIDIPRNKLIVVTGLSGSGKSTLAFDTIFAEGQRRYVESLSAYARQFLGRVNKPDVDSISGIPPAIAIEQKVNTRNPRSTVGTSTEVYDYIKLLYARIGKTYSPVSGVEVKSHSVSDVVDFIVSQPEGTRMQIMSPFCYDAQTGVISKLTLLMKEGLQRLEVNGEPMRIEEVIKNADSIDPNSIFVIIDRIAASKDEDSVSRYGDSVQTAFGEGNGKTTIKVFPAEDEPFVENFSNLFEVDGMQFEEPNVHMFSFNSPLGACPKCEGYGKVIGIDEDLVIPDKTISVYDDAIAPWRGDGMKVWKEELIYNAASFDFPIHRPYCDLTPDQQQLLWRGNSQFAGINAFFEYLEEKKYKIQYRVMLSRYMGKTICPVCNGARLKPEASYVKVGGTTISQLVLMPIDELHVFFDALQIDEHQAKVAKRILVEIRNRLQFLTDVGLGYLTLNRLSATLSGGESQRINLATSLGSSLVGSLYILDEPSIGLHPRDTNRLIKVLKQLRDLGNSVIVVEHEEEIMRAADEIIDIGPMAGQHGGEVVFQGPHTKLPEAERSLTAKYLLGIEKIPVPTIHRRSSSYIEVQKASENNLKNVSVRFPLGVMTAVTGVSGSGKSTLVRTILHPALNRAIMGTGDKPGKHAGLAGDISMVKGVEMVDQNPIGKSSRSNPVTYIKAYDEIRKLFADQQYAKQNGFTPSHFSFNIDGGRCEECQGEGVIKVEMQFMADVTLVCESCGGKRFKQEVLEVRYKDKSIYDILEMTVDEAIAFFGSQDNSTAKKVAEKLQPLQDVGLGYVRLGQSSSTLSGGEAQRIKLASFLGKDSTNGPILFIFDEPTTGLHFHDIRKLLDAFQALLANGHTIIIVEHNMDVIKCADWVVDLGPEGGEKGGNLVFEGTPEELAMRNDLHTGNYLAEHIK
jgi:excinuclease ABC subunit A